MGRQALYVLALLPPLLLSGGCRNPHSAKDQLQRNFEASARQYQQDCPASARAGDPKKEEACRVENDRVLQDFQKLQAADRK